VKSHLLPAAKLAAKSFFHSESGPGIIMLFQTVRNEARASFIEIHRTFFLLNASKEMFRLKRLFEGSLPFFTTSKRASVIRVFYEYGAPLSGPWPQKELCYEGF